MESLVGGDLSSRDGELEIGNTSAQAHLQVSMCWKWLADKPDEILRVFVRSGGVLPLTSTHTRESFQAMPYHTV